MYKPIILNEMKKLLFLITVLIFSSVVVNAQNQPDTITVNKVKGGYQYLMDGKVLTLPELESLLNKNTESSELYKSAKETNGFLSVLSYAGGFLVGYPIGQAIGGGEALWELAAVGAGLIVIAIPIANGVTKKMNKAVQIYNSGIQPTSFWDDKELKLQLTGNGVGLAFRF